MNNYDDHKTGLHDENSPMNRKEEESDDRTIEQLINDGLYPEALEKLGEVQQEISYLREKAKVSNDTFYFKKLTSIYNKL